MVGQFGANSNQDEVTLRWDPERGFDFDFMAVRSHCAVRISGVPIPADGTTELREKSLELDRLEILFKAQVTIHGEPGQLMEAAVQVSGTGENEKLCLAAKLEDVETGEILDFSAEVPIEMPSGVPLSGGPRRMPAEEDDLDWEDEATFERMLGDPMDMPFGLSDDRSERVEKEPRTAPDAKGLEALLKALATVDEDELPLDNEAGDADDTEWGEELPPSSAPLPVAQVEDGLMSADEEARQFLQLLVDREDLELEDGSDVESLVSGASEILQGSRSASRMASELSEWLLDQDDVADLYIDDEDLGELLSQW